MTDPERNPGGRPDVPHHVPTRRPLSAALLLALLAVPGDAFAGSTGVHFPTGPALDRARQVAAAWPGSPAERIWRTGYFPHYGGERWLPAGFSRNDGAFAAFLGGRVDLPAEFPAATTGTVAFPDGTTLTLPLTNPHTIAEDLTRQPEACTREPCNTRLAVTAVRLGTRPQVTSRGRATVPVWEFVLDGLDEPYAVAAVTSQEPADLPGHYDDLPAGNTDVHDVWRDWDGGLHGTLHPRDCAEALPGAVYETAAVVVLVGRTTGRPGDCGSYGPGRDSRFRFAHPPGDRVLLNLAGRPLLFPGD
ncbi:hypothetical protein [Kitasatospora sp. NPDC093806]|uniref:hypothetical protein n=1 Tax=Kitasatospora sp. NPDC093806 TaxID=3155075 RepID=UPI00341389C0